METDSGQAGVRATPLGVFGAVLAVLVLIDVLAWLWGQTIGADLLWWLFPYLGGIALIVLWLIYLAAWAVRRKRFAWHLLIIPVIGLLAIAAAVTGLPHKARWAYDEPRLTEVAKAVLADPRPEFSDSTDRTIGSLRVYATNKRDGAAILSFFGGSFSVETLEYRPDGSVPAFGGEVRGRRLSDDWWLVFID